MLQLLTKNGSQTGNAILTEITFERDFVFHIETDFGNTARLSYSELQSLFTYGIEMDYARWAADREAAIANSAGDEDGPAEQAFAEDFPAFLKQLFCGLTTDEVVAIPLPGMATGIYKQSPEVENFAYGMSATAIRDRVIATFRQANPDYNDAAINILMLSRGEDLDNPEVVSGIETMILSSHGIPAHRKAVVLVVFFADNYTADERPEIEYVAKMLSCDHVLVEPVFVSANSGER